ncbi:hypothetical protein C9374_003207 [Naegleria lovaniensis]|uniref:Uncharacterized protein n=1 Tax=Naegleria lovaniensis TaxID=51637 RepID=A0AA88GTM7_NAELO|nr:uncharacterized protein C9374_003207 [Naegleria lovaniensis]KAG2386058.1 hypothetical protein C9374_003207 [Naegleria lovaniensis]
MQVQECPYPFVCSEYSTLNLEWIRADALMPTNNYAAFSHSLSGTMVLSLILTVLYVMIQGRGKRSFLSLFSIMFMGVFSHWLLDVVVHRPDMSLFPPFTQTLIGMGAWHYWSRLSNLLLEYSCVYIGLAGIIATRIMNSGMKGTSWSFWIACGLFTIVATVLNYVALYDDTARKIASTAVDQAVLQPDHATPVCFSYLISISISYFMDSSQMSFEKSTDVKIKNTTQACTPLNQYHHDSIITPEQPATMSKASPCQSDKSTPVDSAHGSSPHSTHDGQSCNLQHDQVTTPIKKKSQRLAISPFQNTESSDFNQNESHTKPCTNNKLKEHSSNSSPLLSDISPSYSSLESDEAELDMLAFTSPIVDPRTNHFGTIRGGARMEDCTLEEVDGALNHLQLPSKNNSSSPEGTSSHALVDEFTESDQSSLTTKSDDICFTPSPPMLREQQAIPEWRIKDDKEVASSPSDLFSAFGSTRTPDKRRVSKISPSSGTSYGTMSANSITTPNKCKGAWFNTGSNRSTPQVSSSDKSFLRSPLSKACEEVKTISRPMHEQFPMEVNKLLHKWTHLQRHAPHALHVHCAILKQKAPCPSLVTNASSFDFECKYRLLNHEGVVLTSIGTSNSRVRARNMAATSMLIQLYPEFQGDVLQIMKHLDQQLKEKNINLRKIITDENDVAHQEETFKLIDEKVIKEGFNPTSTVCTRNESPHGEGTNKCSDTTNSQLTAQSPSENPYGRVGPFPMFDQVTGLPFPLEEPIKVLNEVIHLKGFNYPTCRHKEFPSSEVISGQPAQHGEGELVLNRLPTIHSIIMVLETHKGVYYSEGKGYDVRQAKSECAWKMLNYLFPYLNGNWALILNQIERLREQKRKEKLQKREFGAKRKLDFSNMMPTDVGSSGVSTTGPPQTSTGEGNVNLDGKLKQTSSNSATVSAHNQVPSCKSCAVTSIPVPPQPFNNNGYPFYFISPEGIPLQTQQHFPPNNMMMVPPMYYPPPPSSQFFNPYVHHQVMSSTPHHANVYHHPFGFLPQQPSSYTPQHGPFWFSYGGFQQQPQQHSPNFGFIQPSSNDTNKKK